MYDFCGGPGSTASSPHFPRLEIRLDRDFLVNVPDAIEYSEAFSSNYE